MTLTRDFSRVQAAERLGDVILVDEYGDAYTWGGGTTPIYDFTLGDIARFDTDREAEEFAAQLAPARFKTVSELPEELRGGMDQ
jgi:hypothetical protein